jgi:hypothetical protein
MVALIEGRYVSYLRNITCEYNSYKMRNDQNYQRSDHLHHFDTLSKLNRQNMTQKNSKSREKQTASNAFTLSQTSPNRNSYVFVPNMIETPASLAQPSISVDPLRSCLCPRH